MRETYRSNTDIEVCRAIHRRYGTTYYYSTLRFPAEVRWRVHGVYAFVRIADEWVDNPGPLTTAQQRENLESWRSAMLAGAAGTRPDHPAMRVFCDVVRETQLPIEEANCFIDAMLMDIDRNRYRTYEELRGYMKGSACAIGVLMCYAVDAYTDPDSLDRARALGEAMQLTNFLRDIGEDLGRGRIYIPEEDMLRFGVTEEDLREARISQPFQNLMTFEIERARALYAYADPGIQRLPEHARKAILLARLLYARILDRIEKANYDVFSRRARTTFAEKLLTAVGVSLTPDRLFGRLEGTGSPT